MIKSFRCKDAQALYEGGSPRRFRAWQTQAERKLQMLDSAAVLDDLKSPPGNRLETQNPQVVCRFQGQLVLKAPLQYHP